MAKTLKQIADEIGISKQRVYRFVKQEGITGTHQENQTIYYDEQAEQTIKVAFQVEPHHKAVSDFGFSVTFGLIASRNGV